MSAEGGEESKPESTTTTTMDEDTKAVVEKVKDRLQFFFSDANVRQDYFIRKLLMNEKSDEPNMVPIESLLRFNTIKCHTTKAEVVVAAAKELSDKLTVNEKGTAIGRVVPFTQEMMDGNVPKSLFVKGIPVKSKEGQEDFKQYAVTVDEVKALFEPYGEVEMVKLLWSLHSDGHKDKQEEGNKKRRVPNGCALVEFASESSLEKAAEATLTIKDGESVEPKDKLELGEGDDDKKPLVVMLLSEKQKSKKQKDDSGNGNSNNKRKQAEDKSEKEVKEFKMDWQKGCVIKIKGVPADCDREALLDMLATGMGISVEQVKDKKIYVDYSRGNTDGAIRFPQLEDHIADICKRLKEGELEIKGAKVEDATTLEGEEEKKYWDEFIAFKNRQIKQRSEEKRGQDKRGHKRQRR